VTRLAVLAVPQPGLRDGWESTCRRWAEEAGAEVVAIRSVPGSGLAQAVTEVAGRADGLVLSAGDRIADEEIAAAVSRAGARSVHVALEADDHPGPLVRACDREIHGRGFAGLFWALRHLVAWHERPARTLRYGPDDAHVADLRLPTGNRPAPACVLLHGGFWSDAWGRDTLDGVATDLAVRGWVTWNAGYRRLGPTRGGWPQTWDDVALAVDALADVPRADRARVAVLGHSVGAALACWAAARTGGDVRPAVAASLAGVLDLRGAAETALGGGTTAELVGDPADHPERYAAASPVEIVPLGVPTLLAHGADDDVVPPDITRSYAAAASSAGDSVRTSVLPGSGHFDVIDPLRGPAWGEIARHLQDLVGT
jgi:acetyl esterase/lipase